MVALVKAPHFYSLQMFPNLCVQIYSLGLGFSTLMPNLVHSTTSDSVTRVNDSTRVTICGDSDSSHVFHKMTRTRDLSQNHFYNIFEFLMDKPS